MSLDYELERLVGNLRTYRQGLKKQGIVVSDSAGLEECNTQLDIIYSGYDRGYSVGYNDGLVEGNYQGKQFAYDEFWNLYQDYGKRTDCANMFSGRGWTSETFRPKYSMRIYNAYMLFRYCGITGDLGTLLGYNGTKFILDTNILQYTFNNTLLEVIDGIEFTKPITRFDSTFAYSGKLREIKVPLPITETTLFGGFDGCSALEEIRFNGTIGTTLNLKWSTKLSKASIENIIGCLSPTISGLSITLSGAAVEGAFGSTVNAEWTNLIDTKSNWTINLL